MIALSSDHAGIILKDILIKELKARGDLLCDLGTNDSASVDYPDYAAKLGKMITNGQADFGIAICGSGIGMSIALNRYPNVRAALCHDRLTASLARRHNNANVLVLGARLIGIDQAIDCLYAFMDTAFEGGRHEVRVKKLSAEILK